MGIAATVSRAPSDADDTLDLHWLSPRDGEDGEESVGEKDLRWVSTSRLPAEDDDALLFIDSLGDPWAFVWATGVVMGDASLAALSARLDLLEAHKTTRGTGAVTFSASAHSANATVTHLLGTTPAVVTFGVYNDIQIEIVSKGATTFVVQGWAPAGAISASLAFDWIAEA
jgi:hypothetical protein